MKTRSLSEIISFETFMNTDEICETINLTWNEFSNIPLEYKQEFGVFRLDTTDSSVLLFSYLNEKNPGVFPEDLLDKILNTFYSGIVCTSEQGSNLKKYSYKNGLVASGRYYESDKTSKILLLLPWQFASKNTEPILFLNEDKYKFIVEGILKDVKIY